MSRGGSPPEIDPWLRRSQTQEMKRAAARFYDLGLLHQLGAVTAPK